MDVSNLSLTPPSPKPLLPTPPSSTPPSSPFDWRKIHFTIDIPVEEDTAYREILEKPTKGVAMHQNRKVDHLMAKFTRGFDPSTLGAELMVELPELAQKVLPGSYEQLFVILLETPDNMDQVQRGLQDWLCRRYPQLTRTLPPITTEMTDESYFLTELQMLRKLLEPLRGKKKMPIYWMNTRRTNSVGVCEQLEAAVEVIEELKRDVLEALEKDTEDRSCYSALPVSNPRSSMMSMREVRIDACKATLKWDEFAKAELELSRFYHFYRNDLLKNRPEKAHEEGWLPPTTIRIPPSCSEMVKEGDLVVWPAHRGNSKVFNLLLKTALWLAVARGLAAVHLFCDVVRLFTAHEPSRMANKDYISFLKHLAQIRANDGVRSNVSIPFPYSDGTVASWNPDYFEDVWKINRTLMARLTERPSLLEKKRARTLTHTHPPCKDVRIPPRTRAGLPGSWPRAATAYVNRGSSVYEESTVAPHRVIPRSRSTSVFQEKASPLFPRASLLEIYEDVLKKEG